MKKRKEHTLKKALVYLMLIVYTFGLIKPIMPIIDDVLAHTFFKNEHIATVHYENGKQHIHLELIKEASKPASKQTPLLSNSDSFLVHIKSDCVTFIPYTKQIMEINTPYLDVPIEIIISTPQLPPEC